MPGLASVLANLCPLPTSSRCFRQAVAEMLEEFEELKDKKMVTKKRETFHYPGSGGDAVAPWDKTLLLGPM